VHDRHRDNNDKFALKPSSTEPLPEQHQSDARDPSDSHGWHHDEVEEAVLHRLERFRLLGSDTGNRVIDEQPWQVEQPCHPGDHGDDM